MLKGGNAMSRLRLYKCPECEKYGLRQTPKTGKKMYACQFCNAKVQANEVDKEEWEDSDGDITTNKPIDKLDGEMELALEETILIQQQASKIVALIPEASRHLYPDDDKAAAVKFYAEHKDMFQ